MKVVDFGIARFLSGESTATKAGLVFGTARYISPEAAEGLPTDTRSDVYSIGTLAYQLLCGETPFESPSPVALLMQHVHEQPSDLRDRTRGDLVPDPVADVIMQAIEKDPDARFASASEMAEALTHAALEADVDLQRYNSRETGCGLAQPYQAPQKNGVSSKSNDCFARIGCQPTGPEFANASLCTKSDLEYDIGPASRREYTTEPEDSLSVFGTDA